MNTSDTNILDTNEENHWTDENWVAEYLKIKPNTLRKQRSGWYKYIPYHKVGGLVRYNKLEVKN